MLSESARMSSAAEARFRVQSPNSAPRAIRVMALDPASEIVVNRLSRAGWTHATFFTAAAPGGALQGALRDLSGHTRDLIDEIATADLVVMVATPGENAAAAARIGEACSHRRVMTTTLIGGGASASDEALSKTLAQVRPWSLMVVIANSDDYMEDMLMALRAF